MQPSKLQANCPLRIIIVGGGIAGLSAACCLGQTGHDVTVYESSSTLKEIGAGIQVGPNMARLLLRWGLGPGLESIGTEPSEFIFCRYSTGEKVAATPFGPNLRNRHGAPYYLVHRKDLLGILFEAASKVSKIHFGRTVTAVDYAQATVVFDSGETVQADLIIGADGIHSPVRNSILPYPLKATSIGDAVYRATVSTEEMLKDPITKTLLETPRIFYWMGPDRHIIGYPLRAGTEYNLVMVHPDTDSINSWTTPGDVEAMRDEYRGWDERVTKTLELVQANLQSKVIFCPPLDKWSRGNVVLIGDACHSMPPYRAQAAAMAVEDAAVLSNLLTRLINKEQLPNILEAYQAIRAPRVASVSKEAWANRQFFHVSDGAEQKSRDLAMISQAPDPTHPKEGQNGNVFLNKDKNAWLYGYDADEHVDLWCNENGGI